MIALRIVLVPGVAALNTMNVVSVVVMIRAALTVQEFQMVTAGKVTVAV
jgi:hypothetical protein